MPSITAALSPAVESTRRVLFRPFDLGKWFVLGFAAFLSSLGYVWASGFSRSEHWDPYPPQCMQCLSRAQDWILQHPLLVGTFLVLGLVGVLLLCALFLWLASRGEFVFLDGVVTGRGAFLEPWSRLGSLADSLFRLRFGLLVAYALLSLSILGTGWYLARHEIRSGDPGIHTAMILLGVVGALLLLGLAFAVLLLLITDFIVPVMYRHNLKAQGAVRFFREEILAGHAGTFILYLLLKLGIAIAAGFLIVLGGCLTCCIGFLPYLHNVVFLPVYVFFRAWPLHLLDQFDASGTRPVGAPEPPTPPAW